jgi:hypothetical protein
MKIFIFWLFGAMFSMGVAASVGELTEENCSSHCPALFLGWPIFLGEYAADFNTVTIHKTQDRLPVACQEGAQ